MPESVRCNACSSCSRPTCNSNGRHFLLFNLLLTCYAITGITLSKRVGPTSEGQRRWDGLERKHDRQQDWCGLDMYLRRKDDAEDGTARKEQG